MKRLLLSLLILTITASLAAAQPAVNAWDEPLPPRTPKEFHEQEAQRYLALREVLRDATTLSVQADYDVFYYDLSLDLRDYAARTIYGEVTVMAHSVAADLNEMLLDLCSSLTIDSVFSAGLPQTYTSLNNILTIPLDRVYGIGETVIVRVVYHGTPCQSSIYTSFSYYDRPVGPRTVPSIATLSEPYGARDWWPSKNDPDDKADSVRVSMIVADTLTATSNGVLEAVTMLPPSSKRFTWFERHPISTYLVCVSATNYAHYQDWYVALNGDSVPIEHYTYPERLSQALESWNRLPQMMVYCAQRFGEYPFADEKYGHTMFNWGGAMEHQCNTSYGRSITNGYHTYDHIVLHELAHQWWGDEITVATWPDIWLNEGFASYSEALWHEHLYGPGTARDYQTASWGNDVNDPSGPVYDPGDLFSSNTVYDKGSWILHILRGVVRNDSLFFAALNEYRARHSYDNATTAEFLSDVSDVIGYDVTPFLYTYLYRTNRPHFAVSFGTGIDHGVQKTALRIRQTQTDPDTTFQTRLDLEFSGNFDSELVTVVNSEWEQHYRFELDFVPSSVIVDPFDWILKEVTSEPLAPFILTEFVAEGMRGEGYYDSLAAIGGTGNYSWNVIEGSPPNGISLAPDGKLSGTPTQSGLFTFKVRVEDDLHATDELWFALTIGESLLPPERLTITLSEPEILMLRWSAVAGADSYRVYRAPNADLLNPVWILNTTDTFAVDSAALTPAEIDTSARRFYRVTAIENE
ncbi:MAG: M1 family metallopeptidase [Calditrichota bacterium]